VEGGEDVDVVEFRRLRKRQWRRRVSGGANLAATLGELIDDSDRT
jgi:hypothetical protein